MKPIFFVGALVVAFGAGYLVHDNTNTQSKEVAQVLEETIQPEPKEVAVAESVIALPAGYRYSEEGDVLLDINILAGELSSVWVEYGTSSDNLKAAAVTMEDGLGMGTAGEYGSYVFPIAALDLEMGQTYFYRVVGMTVDGEEVRSGLAMFTAQK